MPHLLNVTQTPLSTFSCMGNGCAATPCCSALAFLRNSHALPVQCRMIQRGVRKFLRMLYLRRRRLAAKLIIQFLRSMQHQSNIKTAFKRLMNSIQTLKVSDAVAMLFRASHRMRVGGYQTLA
jgi:hypothetical protein